MINETTNDNYGSVVLGVEFSEKNNNLYQGYPFSWKVEINYTLSINHEFIVTTKVINLEKSMAIPFYMGFHPYFAVSDISKTVIMQDTCTQWLYLLAGGDDPRTATLIPDCVWFLCLCVQKKKQK